MVYNKNYYLANKEKFLQWQREYRANHKEIVHAQQRRHRLKNREKLLIKKKQYRIKNRDKIKAYRKKPEVAKRERLRMRLRRAWNNHAEDRASYQRNKEKKLAYSKWYRETHKEYEKKRHAKYQKENPRSNRSLPLDLQFAMNQVRKRDGNKCKWLGCNLTFKEAPIHVHHIFPISEYPELQYEQRYMICYCANHHGLFHRYRGDPYSEWITRKENDLEVSKF